MQSTNTQTYADFNIIINYLNKLEKKKSECEEAKAVYVQGLQRCKEEKIKVLQVDEKGVSDAEKILATALEKRKNALEKAVADFSQNHDDCEAVKKKLDEYSNLSNLELQNVILKLEELIKSQPTPVAPQPQPISTNIKSTPKLQPQEFLFCSNCGKQFSQSVAFCTDCGTRLTTQQQPQPQYKPPSQQLRQIQQPNPKGESPTKKTMFSNEWVYPPYNGNVIIIKDNQMSGYNELWINGKSHDKKAGAFKAKLQGKLESGEKINATVSQGILENKCSLFINNIYITPYKK